MFSCFRPSAGAKGLEIDDDRPEPARAAKKYRMLRREATGGSTCSNASSISNESISKLPPCSRASDPKIEAMMMPLPHDARPSRCLRLSHPRVYGNLVSDMKSSKGCRDWRNFNVFYDDEIDMSISADEAARKRAIEYQRKVRELNCSFEWSGNLSDRMNTLDDVDMIG